MVLCTEDALAAQLMLKRAWVSMVFCINVGFLQKMCPDKIAKAEVVACHVVLGLCTLRVTWQDS